MQRAEASELIRLMTSSRAVCSEEEHGRDKCQKISPILSTYWHCSMFKNNLAVLALDRNRELKSHNIILLFFKRFTQCMEVSEKAIILSSLYNQFRDFLIRQPITIYGNFTSHKTMNSWKQCLVFKYHRYSIKDTKCEWSSLASDILDHIAAFPDWMAACQRELVQHQYHLLPPHHHKDNPNYHCHYPYPWAPSQREPVQHQYTRLPPHQQKDYNHCHLHLIIIIQHLVGGQPSINVLPSSHQLDTKFPNCELLKLFMAIGQGHSDSQPYQHEPHCKH